MNTPVALIIFNRPECTARVLEVLARIKPAHLLVIADGPRPDHPTDAERCRATRALIDQIDWDCRLDKNYSDQNLGSKRRPETGIDWVFELVEEAIILEDDCLPDESFFPYCGELLARYRDDTRVMMISGYCFFDMRERAKQSYHFSYLGSTWGWATWRRAWRLNDPQLTRWPEVVAARLIEQLFPDPVHTKFWYDVFARILDDRLRDAWDYQWQLSCWFNSGYRIFPAVNLIRNIGFGDDATHTFGRNPYHNELGRLPLPLVHPELVIRSFEADLEIAESLCVFEGYRVPPPPLSRRLLQRLPFIYQLLRLGRRGLRLMLNR
ncbi:MAG: glycosyltransferase family 2 protein [Acidobacteriota bacterium]